MSNGAYRSIAAPLVNWWRRGLLVVLVGLFAIEAGAAAKTDWQHPFDISLPELARTILLAPGADTKRLAEQLGISRYRVLSRGRQGSMLETRMNDEQWRALQRSACEGSSTRDWVESCETASCQAVQLRGDATPGSARGAQDVQARLVRNAPELVPVPDEADLAAGTCSGPPLIPPLAEPAGAGFGDVTLDLSVLRSADRPTAERLDAPPIVAPVVESVVTPVVEPVVTSVISPEGMAADAGASAETAADVAPRSFEFLLNSGFNPRGGVRLGADELPEDTSDWSLVVGAGCSEVSVPLDSLVPAREPGMVLAIVVSGTAADVASSYSLQVVREIPLDTTGEVLAVFASADNIGQVIAQLAVDGRVSGAQAEYVYGTAALVGHSDPFAWLTYGPEKTGALGLHGEIRGAGQLVAVIDTGVDVEHPELLGRIREFIDVSERGWSADAHGTAVAGIIAANADNGLGSYGVAPEAEILALKACQPKEAGLQARCWTSTLVKALDVAMVKDAGVINMSLAGPPDPLLARYVGLATGQNRIVVAAAGNGGPHAKRAFPAALPGVLAVTAIDASNALYEKANLGDYIDVAAPGVDIVTAAPGGDYPPLSGTSMAAAHTSGVAALMRELMPMMSNREIVAVLSTRVTDLGEPGPDSRFGAGLIDACAAAELMSAAAVICAEAAKEPAAQSLFPGQTHMDNGLDKGVSDELVIELN